MDRQPNEDEPAASRLNDGEEGSSLHKAARHTIRHDASPRGERLRAAIAQVRTEDAELLHRLSC